jgi:hypothetical protein
VIGTSHYPVIVVVWVLAVAFLLYRETKDLPRMIRSLRHGRRAPGRIIRDEREYLAITYRFYPVIIFRDDTGQAYETTLRHQKRSYIPWPQQEVKIAYLPADPKATAVLVGFRYYLPTVVTLFLLLVLMSIAPVAVFWI